MSNLSAVVVHNSHSLSVCAQHGPFRPDVPTAHRAFSRFNLCPRHRGNSGHAGALYVHDSPRFSRVAHPRLNATRRDRERAPSSPCGHLWSRTAALRPPLGAAAIRRPLACAGQSSDLSRVADTRRGLLTARIPFILGCPKQTAPGRQSSPRQKSCASKILRVKSPQVIACSMELSPPKCVRTPEF